MTMGRRREALNFKEINGPFIDCVEEFAYVTYLPTHPFGALDKHKPEKSAL